MVGAVKGLVVHIELVKGWRVCVHSLDGECGELVVGNNSGVDAVLVTHLSSGFDQRGSSHSLLVL